MRLKYKQAKSRRLLLDLAHVLQPNWGHKVVGNDISARGYADNQRHLLH